MMYMFKLIVVMGTVSQYLGPFTVTTNSLTVAIPYFEDFDSGFPVCWTQDQNDDFDCNFRC